MYQPSKRSQHSRYVGKHLKAPEKPRRRGLLALLILLLCIVRIGAEALKVTGLVNRYISGEGLLIYGNARGVVLGDSLTGLDGRSIQIYNGDSGTLPEGEDYVISRDDGKTLEYQGHTYNLNENLVTILFMGIDRELNGDDQVSGNGGQSDVLLLIALDTVTGESTVLVISREAYAQVDEYTGSGNYIGSQFEQITLAFAYGDGGRRSCENTMASVTRLLYGLPISSYIALDMDGVMAANETVGGVKLKSMIDVKMPDGTQVKEGDLIELHGKNLERYIRTRTNDVDANAARMDRQRQYVTEFSKLVIQKSKNNITFPVDVFSSLSPYMITDLELPDVTFLSSCFLKNGAHFRFRTIDGTYGVLNNSSVYYLDEVDLFEAVLDVFYTRVD